MILPTRDAGETKQAVALLKELISADKLPKDDDEFLSWARGYLLMAACDTYDNAQFSANLPVDDAVGEKQILTLMLALVPVQVALSDTAAATAPSLSSK